MQHRSPSSSVLKIAGIAAVVVGLLADIRSAEALEPCIFSPQVAFTNGLEQQDFAASGCIEGITASARGASVDGQIDGTTDGVIEFVEQTGGNALLELGVTQIIKVTATVPFLFLNGPVELGGVTYLVDSDFVRVSGIAHVVTTGQPEGAKVDFTATLDVGGVGGTQTDFAEIACGSTFTDSTHSPCPGVKSPWSVTVDRVGPVLPVVDFQITLSVLGFLDTIDPNQAKLDARNTFEITQMAFLDANGLVVPGVTFTADDGFVFPSEPFPGSPGSVPEPATLALFGIGFAGLGFSRRKRT